MPPMWLTNRLANPVLRRVLRGPAGRRFGGRLAVIRYVGRRTGREHELVAGYRRRADTVWVRVGFPEQKTWWRNFRTPGPVEVWLAGEHHGGTASATSTDPGAAILVRIDLDAPA